MKLPAKYRQYIEKWEWGIVEGAIIGFIFFIMLNPPNPILISILIIQIVQLFLFLARKPVKQSEKPLKPSKPVKAGVPQPHF